MMDRAPASCGPSQDEPMGGWPRFCASSHYARIAPLQPAAAAAAADTTAAVLAAAQAAAATQRSGAKCGLS